MLNFIYALSVTPFEHNLLGTRANDFDYIKNQDYPIHLLYCENNDTTIYCGNPVQGATHEKIEELFENFRKCGVNFKIKYRVVCSKEQSENSLIEQIC